MLLKNTEKMYSNSSKISYLSWNSGFMAFLIFDLLSFCLKDKNLLTLLAHNHRRLTSFIFNEHEQFFSSFRSTFIFLFCLWAVVFSSHENISKNVGICCFSHGCCRYSMRTFLNNILIIFKSDSFLTWSDAHERAVEIYWDQWCRNSSRGRRHC